MKIYLHKKNNELIGYALSSMAHYSCSDGTMEIVEISEEDAKKLLEKTHEPYYDNNNELKIGKKLPTADELRRQELRQLAKENKLKAEDIQEAIQILL